MQTLQKLPSRLKEAIDSMSRKRKAVTFTIDELVVKAIQRVAQTHGDSTSRHIEKVLFDYCKAEGAIGSDEPRLGENRGGDRTQKID